MISPSHPVSGRRVTVVGGQRSGTAVSALLTRRGASVFLTDSGPLNNNAREDLKTNGVEFEEMGHTPKATREADFLVVSPGVPTQATIVQDAMRQQIPVYSEVEVASWFCAAPMVTITGSNGKTTTTSLAAHTFTLSGRETFSGGNIGIPFSTFCEKAGADSIVVLEVSSFQLDHIDTMRPRVSVLLNITPDHLDRYDHTFEKYAASKMRIVQNQSRGDMVVYNIDDAEVNLRITAVENFNRFEPLAIGLDDHGLNGAYVKDATICIRLNNVEEELMQVKESALRGQHNLYNTLAAAVAARVMDVRSEVIRESIRSFEGVAHRLEFVVERDGVKYINDSKATNVNAMWYALESFHEPIILIAGGRDKGNDYSSVIKLVEDKVKVLIALGEGGPRIVDELGHLVETVSLVEGMDDAIRFARIMAVPGDVVLLSPACASFDMFDNYEHRGDTFKELVNEG
ncbi:MAG: UDP-N-acetylmuramoyl-L-alanine--D-glutamate ligase [Rhodothermales bacterium]|nr:UDP-N-acetylmuramoyl-L-alanine--D-glutamate ligase [Rhodothermales bacterium]